MRKCSHLPVHNAESAVSYTHLRLRGSYALGVVSMDNTQEIVAARRGNPLVIGIGEGENMIASDITAIINRTKRYIILDDNEVAIVRPDSVVVMNEFGDKMCIRDSDG